LDVAGYWYQARDKAAYFGRSPNRRTDFIIIKTE